MRLPLASDHRVERARRPEQAVGAVPAIPQAQPKNGVRRRVPESPERRSRECVFATSRSARDLVAGLR